MLSTTRNDFACRKPNRLSTRHGRNEFFFSFILATTIFIRPEYTFTAICLFTRNIFLLLFIIVDLARKKCKFYRIHKWKLLKTWIKCVLQLKRKRDNGNSPCALRILMTGDGHGGLLTRESLFSQIAAYSVCSGKIPGRKSHLRLSYIQDGGQAVPYFFLFLFLIFINRRKSPVSFPPVTSLPSSL